MKMPSSFLAIFLSVAVCLITPVRCPAYPAVTDVYAYFSGSTVIFSANDPSRGYYIDSRTVDTPANLTFKDGVVAWTSKDGMGRDILWYTVYDPGLVRWQTASLGFLSVANLTVADGVVACVVQGYGIPDIITSVFFAIYDPASGAWRTGAQEVPTGGPDHLANKQGIVVFGYGDAISGKVDYYIYDPDRSEWRKGSFSQGGALVSSVSVTDFQAQAVVGGGPHSWGYDPGPGAWSEGAATKPLAAFVAQPASGRNPLLIWFTDMSIGADNWTYLFLDTYNYSLGRSCFRNYTKAGLFGVQYGVSGPGGSDDAPDKTIRVSGSPVALPLLLLD